MISQNIAHAATISEVFLHRVQESADKIAYEHEVGGAWQPVSWRDYGDAVKYAALGLQSLGFQPGDRMAIWGDTMPQWTVLDLGAMALGGCTAGVYQTCTPDQVAYIINDSGAKIVAVDNVQSLQKALSVKHKTPSVRCYITWGGGEDEPADIYSYEAILACGEEHARAHPGAYEDAVASVTPDSTAVLVYTSGTTGPPKGAMLSHKNCLFCCRAVHERLDLNGETANVSFLPLSHVAERVVGFFNRLYSGGVAYFMPDIARFTEVAQAKGPTILGGVPRLFEKAYTAIMEKTENGSPLNKTLFDWAVASGGAVAVHRLSGQTVPARLAAVHAIADRLVLSKIRSALGGRVQFIVCGAAPIAREIVDFFNAVGLPFLEVYGMTECAGISHMNSFEKYRAGTVGTVVPGLECKLAEDGEIHVRGDGVFQGYLNQPEATAEAIDEEGWLHTGDIGEIDEDGFLRITDRKKNLLITAGGKNVAPSNVEMLINREPLISQVLVIGDRRRFLSALITLSTEGLEALQQTEEYAGMSLREIIASEAITRRVRDAVDRANAELARYENVRSYKILDREFSIERGEMTPTMKLKRGVIEEKFSDLIESFYSTRAPEPN